MLRVLVVLIAASPLTALAQQAPPVQPNPPRPQQAPQVTPPPQVAPSPQTSSPPPQPAQQPPQQFAQSSAWGNLPKMQLERQFGGPLQDTIVQRWRDPADGSVCYIYLPISAPVTPPNAAGFQQYGPNTIGSISCMAGNGRTAAAPAAPTSLNPAAKR